METPEQIENRRVEEIKKLNEMEENLLLVEEAFNLKAKKILELQTEKKDLQINMDKAKRLIAVKKNNIKILEMEFWKAKR